MISQEKANEIGIEILECLERVFEFQGFNDEQVAGIVLGIALFFCKRRGFDGEELKKQLFEEFDGLWSRA